MSEQSTPNQAPDPAAEALLARARQAVEMARAAGADDAWATAVEKRSVSLQLRDGKPETVSDATTRTLEIKLYTGGRYGVYSTTDLREPRLRDFIREAVPLTRQLQADPDRRITPPALFATDNRGGDTGAALQLQDPAIARLDSAQRLAWCREMDALVHAEPRLISATSTAADSQVQVASASSNGFGRSYGKTSTSLGVDLSLRDQGTGAQQSERAACLHLADLPSAKAIAEGALARARARLGGRQGPTIKTTMLVESRAAIALLQYLLAPATAANIQQGRSFWPALIDTLAFSDKLSIVDDPLRPLGNDPFPYASLLTPSLVFENVQFSGA